MSEPSGPMPPAGSGEPQIVPMPQYGARMSGDPQAPLVPTGPAVGQPMTPGRLPSYPGQPMAPGYMPQYPGQPMGHMPGYAPQMPFAPTEKPTRPMSLWLAIGVGLVSLACYFGAQIVQAVNYDDFLAETYSTFGITSYSLGDPKALAMLSAMLVVGVGILLFGLFGGFCLAGRNWARVTMVVFAGLTLFEGVVGAVGVAGAAASAAGVVTALLIAAALAAAAFIVLIFQRSISDYMKNSRLYRLSGMR